MLSTKNVKKSVVFLLLTTFVKVNMANAAWLTHYEDGSVNKKNIFMIYKSTSRKDLISFDCKDGLTVTFNTSKIKEINLKKNEIIKVIFIVDKNDPLCMYAKEKPTHSTYTYIYSNDHQQIKELITQLQTAQKKIHSEARTIEGAKLFSMDMSAIGSTLSANQFIMHCKIELPINVPHNS